MLYAHPDAFRFGSLRKHRGVVVFGADFAKRIRGAGWGNVPQIISPQCRVADRQTRSGFCSLFCRINTCLPHAPPAGLDGRWPWYLVYQGQLLSEKVRSRAAAEELTTGSDPHAT
jgi:hypothetical protein